VSAKPSKTATPTARDAARVADFRVALRRFVHQTERVARECGLTPRWYLLLLLIKGAPDLSERSTVTDLADRLHLAQSSVTELVARAEQAGLIDREPSADDARVAYLRLTEEGERRFSEAFQSLKAERQALREAITGLEGEVLD
jgi:DNA-binding MarR family transcriptional regulator